MDSVPATAIEYFRGSAEKLIEERGAVEALAAALAHISGATSLEQRSLLNSDVVSLLTRDLFIIMGLLQLNYYFLLTDAHTTLAKSGIILNEIMFYFQIHVVVDV